MLNEDNACIRYLMKEMDPSEEVLMERAMMEDEDLLIEVECMRHVLKRLDDNLPLINPPSHITEQILQTAAQHPVSKISGMNRLHYFAAAVVVIGFISGLVWFQNTDKQKIPPAPLQSTVTVTSSSYVVTPVVENEAEPWVDRNNMLHFRPPYANQSQAAFDSLLNVSIRKLKPINGTLQSNTPHRVLQLTGSEDQ